MAAPVYNYPPELLSQRAACYELDASATFVEKLFAERAFPVVKIGRRVYVDRKDFRIWIEKNKAESFDQIVGKVIRGVR